MPRAASMSEGWDEWFTLAELGEDKQDHCLQAHTRGTHTLLPHRSRNPRQDERRGRPRLAFADLLGW